MRGWRIILILSALLWGSLDAFAIRAVHPENPCTGDFGGTVSRARYYHPQIGRFWTMDTYEGNEETPGSLHKYLYCQADPINNIDPLGLKLEPPSDTKAKAAYDEALEYLKKSDTARKVINKLEESPHIFKIVPQFYTGSVSGEPSDAFLPSDRSIYWDPTEGLRWKEWFKWKHLTPALLLIHEMGHAYHFETDEKRYGDDVDKKLVNWENREEKRTVREIENPVARELNEDIRNQYKIKIMKEFPSKLGHYTTQGPLSILEGNFIGIY